MREEYKSAYSRRSGLSLGQSGRRFVFLRDAGGRKQTSDVFAPARPYAHMRADDRAAEAAKKGPA